MHLTGMNKMTLTLAGLTMTGALSVAAPSLAASAANAAPASPECKSGDVKVSYRYHDAGAGHRFGYILVKNVSGSACHTGGFGGISYVGHGDGTQVGAAATRTGTHRTLLLRPGQIAVSEISESTLDDYSNAECSPTKVDGFRVYIPNETHSQYVVHKTWGCADTRVKMIDHKAFRHQYV